METDPCNQLEWCLDSKPIIQLVKFCSKRCSVGKNLLKVSVGWNCYHSQFQDTFSSWALQTHLWDCSSQKLRGCVLVSWFICLKTNGYIQRGFSGKLFTDNLQVNCLVWGTGIESHWVIQYITGKLAFDSVLL